MVFRFIWSHHWTPAAQPRELHASGKDIIARATAAPANYARRATLVAVQWTDGICSCPNESSRNLCLITSALVLLGVGKPKTFVNQDRISIHRLLPSIRWLQRSRGALPRCVQRELQ